MTIATKMLRSVRPSRPIKAPARETFREVLGREVVRLGRGEMGDQGSALGRALRMTYLNDWTDEELAGFARIEAARHQFIANTHPLGAPWPVATVGEMVKRASKGSEEARLLYALLLNQEPREALEMGTCCGVSTTYMSLGLPPVKSRLTSLELSPVLTGTARMFIDVAGGDTDRVDIRVGDFADTLKPFVTALGSLLDFAFVDGNHHYEPTMEYFHALVDACPPGAMLVFDDIRWTDPSTSDSDDMIRAWSEIIAHPRVRDYADVATMGVVVLR